MHHFNAEEEQDLETLTYCCESGNVLLPIVGCNHDSCFIEEEWALHFLQDTTLKLLFFIIMLLFYPIHYILVLGLQIWILSLFTMPLMWNVASSEKIRLFYKTAVFHFQLHFLVKLVRFHFVDAVIKLKQLVRFKMQLLVQYFPHHHF